VVQTLSRRMKKCKTKHQKLITQCFIQIQLDVQYSFFLKSFLLTVLKWQSVPTPLSAPWNKHTKTIKKKPIAVHYSCAPDDGCMWHPKHLEQKTFQEKRILYIQFDLNKTYVTKMYWTTNIKFSYSMTKCYIPEYLSLQPRRNRIRTKCYTWKPTVFNAGI
jgi:hypothetical protein